MNKNLHQTLKTVLISSLVSVNSLIWYDLLGTKFLLAIAAASLFVLFTSKTENA